MPDTKRVPTELEAKLLLREVGRRMEDEQALGEYLEVARRRWRSPGAIVAFALLACFGGYAGGYALGFLEKQGPGLVWMAIGGLAFVALTQSIQIGRLMRVTCALARAAERTRSAEPLPRAPSPPAAD